MWHIICPWCRLWLIISNVPFRYRKRKVRTWPWEGRRNKHFWKGKKEQNTQFRAFFKIKYSLYLTSFSVCCWCNQVSDQRLTWRITDVTGSFLYGYNLSVLEPVRVEHQSEAVWCKLESWDMSVRYGPSLCPILTSAMLKSSRPPGCVIWENVRAALRQRYKLVMVSRTRWTIQSLFQGMSTFVQHTTLLHWKIFRYICALFFIWNVLFFTDCTDF